MARDPLAAFDAEIPSALEADGNRLRSLARRHQETVRENPGVENLVYEWRRGYPRNSLVERTEDAYYLLVSATTWREFGDALGLDDAEREALRTLHARQFAADVGDAATADEGSGDDGGTTEGGGTEGERMDRHPMVLTRP